MPIRALPPFRVALIAAAFAVAACSGGTASSAPSFAIPSIAIPSFAIPSIAIPSFALPSGVVLPSIALPSGGAALDVCSLFQKAELEQITGRTLLTAAANQPPGCTWEFESGQPGLNWELIVGVTRPGGKQAFDNSKPFAGDGSPVPDVGYDNYPVVGNTIFAVKDDTMVDVQWLDLSSSSKGAEVPKQLAKLALDRLP